MAYEKWECGQCVSQICQPNISSNSFGVRVVFENGMSDSQFSKQFVFLDWISEQLIFVWRKILRIMGPFVNDVTLIYELFDPSFLLRQAKSGKIDSNL